jgi:hypothetical protein
MTKRSTTELTPTVEHTAEAPTFIAIDGKSMRNAHKSERTPLRTPHQSKRARDRRAASDQCRNHAALVGSYAGLAQSLSNSGPMGAILAVDRNARQLQLEFFVETPSVMICPMDAGRITPR